MLHAGRFWTTAVARSLSALRTMNREMCWRRFQYFLIAPLAHPGLFGVGRSSRWSVVGGRDAFDEAVERVKPSSLKRVPVGRVMLVFYQPKAGFSFFRAKRGLRFTVPPPGG